MHYFYRDYFLTEIKWQFQNSSIAKVMANDVHLKSTLTDIFAQIAISKFSLTLKKLILTPLFNLRQVCQSNWLHCTDQYLTLCEAYLRFGHRSFKHSDSWYNLGILTNLKITSSTMTQKLFYSIVLVFNYKYFFFECLISLRLNFHQISK